MAPQINPKRLLNDLRTLRKFGAAKDHHLGVRRVTYSEADMESRQWLLKKFREAGLEAEIDGVGNVYGRSKNKNHNFSSNPTTLLLGSHSDTQPEGGWLDGALGVVYALEVARAINDDKESASKYSVDIVSFADEEGTYLGMVGSRTFCNLIDHDKKELESAIKFSGEESLIEALRRTKLFGQKTASFDPTRHFAFFEAHIEQGPFLEQTENKIGIVTGIVGIRGVKFVLTGEQNHAGTTPMFMRKDAGMQAIMLGSKINEEFEKSKGERTVWTFGDINFNPGSHSIIPGECELYLQWRDDDEGQLNRFANIVENIVEKMNKKSKVQIEMIHLNNNCDPAPCDKNLQNIILKSAKKICPNDWSIMPSGAAHDAQILAKVVPSAMLFVPSISGISHNFAENTLDGDLVMGCKVYLDACIEMLNDQHGKLNSKSNNVLKSNQTAAIIKKEKKSIVEEFKDWQMQGVVTSVDITRYYLSRINRYNHLLNAVIEINPEALNAADKLDKERANGNIRSPLHGIPILIKDNINTDDLMDTTAGSLALLNSKPNADAFIITKLRKAGCIILGKTNLSEWANFRGSRSHDGWSARGGQTRNPYDLNKSAVGSSSGSGSAVAAQLAPLAVGTETNGSISCPSMVCGICGFKPSVGSTSRSGIIPIASSLDSAGPMGKSMKDIIYLYNEMIGYDPNDIEAVELFKNKKMPLKVQHISLFQKDPRTVLKGKRIGVLRGDMFIFDKHIMEVYERSIALLSANGATIIDNLFLLDTTVDVLTGKFNKSHRSNTAKLMLFEMKHGMEQYLRTTRESKSSNKFNLMRNLDDIIQFNAENAQDELSLFGQEFFIEATKCESLPNKDHAKLKQEIRQAAGKDGIDYLLNKYQLDCLIMPSGRDAPYLPGKRLASQIGVDDKKRRITSVPKNFSTAALPCMAGAPLLVVPSGLSSKTNMPLGLSFTGTVGSDSLILEIGYAFEQCREQSLDIHPPQLFVENEETLVRKILVKGKL